MSLRRFAVALAVIAAALPAGCGDGKSTAGGAVVGQRSKADDSGAKSDARNAVSQAEACFADTNDYAACAADPNLAATVDMIAAGANTYTLTALSPSGARFSITRTAAGTYLRTCTGCAGGTW